MMERYPMLPNHSQLIQNGAVMLAITNNATRTSTAISERLVEGERPNRDRPAGGFEVLPGVAVEPPGVDVELPRENRLNTSLPDLPIHRRWRSFARRAPPGPIC